MGMIFAFALAVAKIIKPVMVKMKINHLVSPPLMKRIAGWAIDYMVLTTIMAVQIQNLGNVVFGWSEFTTILVILGFALVYVILLKVVKGWGKPTYSLLNNESSQKESNCVSEI